MASARLSPKFDPMFDPMFGPKFSLSQASACIGPASVRHWAGAGKC